MSSQSYNPWLLLFALPFFKIHLCYALDTIFAGQSLSGNQTITSNGGVFELGFFNPGNSSNYYIGIWYKMFPRNPVVWVANRNQPISNPTFSQLKLTQNGNLILVNQTQSKTQIWSTNSTSNNPNSTIAILLDNGNLVLRDKIHSSLIWQSFDYPTDTWLPGGKVGYSRLRNEKMSLSSWKSPENPAQSLFSMDVEPSSSHTLVWNESRLYWTSGEWDGKVFKLVPEIAANYYIKNATYVVNENESYFTYEPGFPNVSLTRFVLDVTGQLLQLVWMKNFGGWRPFWTRPTQQCEVYGYCGGFSSCSQNIPLCECIEGFKPSSPKDWELGDHTGGCLRESPLECELGKKDSFSVMPNTQFPLNSETLAVGNMKECQQACLSNCSCTAYAYDNGCLVWKGDLFNLLKLSSNDGAGRDIHVRVLALEQRESEGMTKKKIAWIVAGSVGGFVILLILLGIVLVLGRKKRQRDLVVRFEDSLMVFKYQEIKMATKNFSEKLGEGGFGTVFKGTLPNSTTIAVKMLKSQIKGEKQFRAEVSTIGMIQHVNLVRLRGICLKGTKRFLVYEYMSNGSLESHLFHKGSSKTLAWKTRFGIAIGTARGLAYLHEKCRDCIIHCDIKPDNILLDADYNPIVADFGLAKLVGREFSRVLTTMRGTRGYLAPEWISGEPITPKADVFSYGMVLFEIISGRRNRDSVNDEKDRYFPAKVADRINEAEEVSTLLDSRLEGKADEEEVLRACKVAVWCIQQDERDRPTMGQVVQILEGVSDIGMPPIPRFLRDLAGNPAEVIAYKETPTISVLTTS